MVKRAAKSIALHGLYAASSAITGAAALAASCRNRPHAIARRYRARREKSHRQSRIMSEAGDAPDSGKAACASRHIASRLGANRHSWRRENRHLTPAAVESSEISMHIESLLSAKHHRANHRRRRRFYVISRCGNSVSAAAKQSAHRRQLACVRRQMREGGIAYRPRMVKRNYL